jgi:predicted acylesterase/phospholipase RssA
MTIKHLVISGGGPSGVLIYGIVSQLEKKGFWNLTNIKSIYGCSIGAYIGVILSLGYEWEWLDDYFIKRPWDKLVTSSKTRLIDIYEKKCLLNENFYREGTIPLLRAKNLSDDITLLELYEYNNIDIHMYATNINSVGLEKIDISHKTHPNLSLITSLRMTMAFPLIFEPIFYENNCYIDGGLVNNFPLNDCLSQQKCDPDEILGFKNIYKTDNNNSINEKSSLLEFTVMLIKKMQSAINTEPEQEKTKYTVNCLLEDLSGFDKWYEALHKEECRRKIVENGYLQADLFLSYVSKITD